MSIWGESLRFRSLEIKNRVFRASRAYARGAEAGWSPLDWELKYARAGVGAIISARVEVCPAAGSARNGPAIHEDEAIGPWQPWVGRIHAYHCRYLIRLGHARVPHGSLALEDFRGIVQAFAEAGRRARETGADGVEIDGGEGSLIEQYLAPGVKSDRPAGYQGSLEHRARLVRQIVRGVRHHVGPDFHVQVLLGVTSPLGMMAAGTLRLVEWLQHDGIDAVHIAADAVAARYLRDTAAIPVVRGGRFETEAAARAALGDGSCDAVALETREVATPWRPAA
ncbi:MAG TPA: hypothetical protein VIG99_26440 [Myxococcaceae bacterium]